MDDLLKNNTELQIGGDRRKEEGKDNKTEKKKTEKKKEKEAKIERLKERKKVGNS